jgi:hypothetical protein
MPPGKQQQIPCENDRKKGKSNDGRALLVSHPSPKNYYVARVGHRVF